MGKDNWGRSPVPNVLAAEPLSDVPGWKLKIGATPKCQASPSSVASAISTQKMAGELLGKPGPSPVL